LVPFLPPSLHSEPLLLSSTLSSMPDLIKQAQHHPQPSPALSRSSRASPAAPPPASPAHNNHNPRQVRWGTDEVFSQRQSVEGTADDGQDEEQESQADEDDEGDGKSVLAISAMKNKVGCCYFDAATQKLHFIEDQNDSGSWDLTNLSSPLAIFFSRCLSVFSLPNRSTNEVETPSTRATPSFDCPYLFHRRLRVSHRRRINTFNPSRRRHFLRLPLLHRWLFRS
jgi:hypothetical protein